MILAWRGTTPLIVTVVSSLVILASLWFSNSEGLRLTAAQGHVGIRAESALSSASAARNEAAQALLVSSVVVDKSDPALEASLDLVSVASDRLTERSEALGEVAVETRTGVLEKSTALSDSLLAFTEALRSGAGTDEVSVFTAEIEPAYQDYVGAVVDVRDSALRVTAIEQSSAGRLALAARLFVAIVIPVFLVLGFRIGAVRRQRQQELKLSLEHERSLNSVKDEAIANLSHELRTPLTSIQGYAFAMLEDDLLSDEEAAREMIEVIARESVDLGRMIEDLLVAARHQAGALPVHLEPTDVSAEIDLVLEPLLATGAMIGVETDEAKVLVDRLRLRQILRNLVFNAVKHGGDDVQIRGVAHGSTYSIAVSDDGVGVPDHVADRLFTRFVHEGESPLLTGSVGLGLAITKELAKLLNGDVSYFRAEDRTVFELTVPLAE